MKDSLYTDAICRNFCCYYKAGREELKCGGYQFLMEHLTPKELLTLSNGIAAKEALKKYVPADNKDISDLVCRKCKFLIDGCDYRDGIAAPPCGGYLLIDKLFC
jgi:hypothetical protein